MKRMLLGAAAALMLTATTACMHVHGGRHGGPGGPGCPKHQGCDCTCRQQKDCPQPDCPSRPDCPKQQQAPAAK